MIKFLLSLIFLFLLTGCFIFGPRPAKAKVLYEGKFSDIGKIRISYSNYRDNNLYRILLYQNGNLVEHLEITDNPQFVIDKLILSEKGTNSVFRIVSDTANSQLRCINFNFPEKHCNPGTLLTFVPITEKEREIFKLFSKVLAENKHDIKFSNSLEEKLIGWVRVYY